MSTQSHVQILLCLIGVVVFVPSHAAKTGNFFNRYDLPGSVARHLLENRVDTLNLPYNVDSFEIKVTYIDKKVIVYGVRKLATNRWYVDDPEFDYKITECESLDMAIKYCLENRNLEVMHIMNRRLLLPSNPIHKGGCHTQF